MIQGYFRTKNLTPCLKRLQNQYGIISPDTDWDGYSDDESCKGRWTELWPKCMGEAYGTKLEQDEENDDYLFNIQLTQEQVDSLPNNDTPNFWFQYEGELTDPDDPESPPLPTPTFKVKQYDEDGVWLGTYYDRTICVMR